MEASILSLTHHPDVELLWNYWPFYHFVFWFIRYPLNAVFFIPYFFTLPLNFLWNIIPQFIELILEYSIPATITFLALIALILFILIFVTIPQLVLWILVTAFGLLFWAGFCIVVLIVFIVIPLVLFLLWWLFILFGSLFFWFPISALLINLF